MAELSDLLATKIYHSKREIHDCVDTGDDLSLTTTEVLYPCDCAGRNYLSGEALWDDTTSIFSNGILDSALLVKWSFTAEASVPGRKITINIVIPDAGGDIPIETIDYFIDTQNVDQAFGNSRQYYNGPEALAAGFKVTIVGDGAFTLKGRSISVVVV